MSRTARSAAGGMVFRVLNRGVGRRALFDQDADRLAFEQIREESLRPNGVAATLFFFYSTPISRPMMKTLLSATLNIGR